MTSAPSYPFGFDDRGRTATSDGDAHIREMIEQFLFTAPGERVNRPDFGSGLYQMVFAPASNELAAATQFLVQGNLQQWLSDVVVIEAVDIKVEESTLYATIRYRNRSDNQQHTIQIDRSLV